jgi:hypothetical protein
MVRYLILVSCYIHTWNKQMWNSHQHSLLNSMTLQPRRQLETSPLWKPQNSEPLLVCFHGILQRQWRESFFSCKEKCQCN